jgi:hypothetical protein
MDLCPHQMRAQLCSLHCLQVQVQSQSSPRITYNIPVMGDPNPNETKPLTGDGKR